MSFIRSVLKKTKVAEVEDEKKQIGIEVYDSTYTIVKDVLKIAGLRLMRQDTPLVKKCWNAFYWFCFGNMAFVTVLELMALVQTVKNKVYGEFFRMMPVIGYMLLAMSKSYKITYRRAIFENLISELRDMWPEGELSDEEYNVIKRDMKYFRFAYGSYYLTVVLSFIFSYPPIIIIFKTAVGLEADKMYLPYVYWLPFDPFQSLGVYSTMIAIETFHCVTTIWAMMSADLLFCIFLNHITIQLDLLCIRIRKLFYVPVDGQLIQSYPLGLISKETRKNNKDEQLVSHHENHLRELNVIIKRHQSLIRLAGDVENMFSLALLVNFLNSSIIICFSGLSVIFIEKWSDPHYKAFFISTIIQNWIVCWYGQQIIDASTGVVSALYNSGWYRADRKVRTSILIMMHRAQKELHVTTWGFSVISLSTFTNIMKSSWSYFTLLINVLK